jgi:hypothetical protein
MPMDSNVPYTMINAKKSVRQQRHRPGIYQCEGIELGALSALRTVVSMITAKACRQGRPFNSHRPIRQSPETRMLRRIKQPLTGSNQHEYKSYKPALICSCVSTYSIGAATPSSSTTCLTQHHRFVFWIYPKRFASWFTSVSISQ